MLNNFRVFEELVFFDLWIPDSGFWFPVPVSGFRFRVPDSGFLVLGLPKDNSLHLGRKYARIFVLGHYLFLVAYSFPRASLSENCSLLGTDNVRGQIHRMQIWRTTRLAPGTSE